MKCFLCRDEGMPEGCPDCGKVLDTSHSIESPLTQKIYMDLEIPEYYRGMVWNEDVLISAHLDRKEEHTFKEYVSKLTATYKCFLSGAIPTHSRMIIAPRNYGKLTWAYACLQQAAKHNYNTVPIIDNTQFKRLNILSSDRISSQALKKLRYSIEDYLTADVMFMTIDPDNFQGSYRTIDSLLSKRARFGKATFIISRNSLEDITLLDRYSTFESIFCVPNSDSRKHISLIRG